VLSVPLEAIHPPEAVLAAGCIPVEQYCQSFPGQGRSLDLSRSGQPLKLIACHYLKVEVGRMRLVGILVSAIMLTCICISIQAYAIEPGAIAEPSMSVPNMDMPQPRITPNMDMPDPKSKPPGKADNNADQILNQTGNVSNNQTQTIQTPQEVSPMDVSGRWSIKLDEGSGRSLNVNLWSSSGNRIMGYGTLTEGGTENSVTVSGSVIGQELVLSTKPATPEYANQKNNEYDLDLFMVNNTLSGTYVLRSGEQFEVNGNATAVKL
jgi:hypothetical protein